LTGSKGTKKKEGLGFSIMPKHSKSIERERDDVPKKNKQMGMAKQRKICSNCLKMLLHGKAHSKIQPKKEYLKIT